jgi:hypothetical protein
MVLADRQPLASRVVTVRFEGAQASGAASLTIGSGAVVYVASVRASSKVISVAAEPAQSAESPAQDEDEDEDAFGFGGFDDEMDERPTSVAPSAVTVTLQFIASKEFIEEGAKVLVMPGGGQALAGGTERGAKGVAGLEGFVGYAIEQH